MLKILNEIAAERKRQDAKWGEQNWNPVEWVAILGEEFGEVSKEALEYYFNKKMGTVPDQPKDVQFQQERLQDYRKELIQVAAVALAMIQSLERNELINFKD